MLRPFLVNFRPSQIEFLIRMMEQADSILVNMYLPHHAHKIVKSSFDGPHNHELMTQLQKHIQAVHSKHKFQNPK